MKLPTKKQLDSIFSCNSLSKLEKATVEILNYRGYSESKFFICLINETEFLLKMSLYKKSRPELYIKSDSLSPHDAEIEILKLLWKTIKDKRALSHIVKVLYVKKCENIAKLLPDDEKFNKQISPSHDFDKSIHGHFEQIFSTYRFLIEMEVSYSRINFILMEHLDLQLSNFIENSNPLTAVTLELLRVILFQIIYTIWSIREQIPDFVHGDLHGENIMIDVDYSFNFDPENMKYIEYIVDSVSYRVPDYGINAKIIDFGFARAPSRGVTNVIVDDKSFAHKKIDNEVIFLLSDIWMSVDKQAVGRMFVQLEPNETFLSYNYIHIQNIKDKIPSYKDMLMSDAFARFRSKSE